MAPGGLYWPAAHTNCVALVDPAAQKYPAVQLLAQLPWPTAALKTPAGHGIGAPLPIGQYVPAGHCPGQVAEPPALYSPALQFVHDDDPAGL